MGDVKQLVDNKIREKKVMMFSKTTCPFCLKAKQLLKSYQADGTLKEEDFESMEIDKYPECEAIQQYLWDLTWESSAPRVFINGKCIGGGEETAAAHHNGTLLKLLQA